jgi:acyl carrier protein
MDVRQDLRQYLFAELLPQPKDEWPDDRQDLFDLGLDSLRIMRLLVAIEERLKVAIPDHEITPERLATVDSLVELITQHQR